MWRLILRTSVEKFKQCRMVSIIHRSNCWEYGPDRRTAGLSGARVGCKRVNAVQISRLFLVKARARSSTDPRDPPRRSTSAPGSNRSRNRRASRRRTAAEPDWTAM